MAPIDARASVMLDIGAHIGSQSLMSARVNPRCQILAFEAQEPMYRLLRKNLEENELLNIVEARNVAVGHACVPPAGGHRELRGRFGCPAGIPTAPMAAARPSTWGGLGCVGRARERPHLWCPW